MPVQSSLRSAAAICEAQFKQMIGQKGIGNSTRTVAESNFRKDLLFIGAPVSKPALPPHKPISRLETGAPIRKFAKRTELVCLLSSPPRGVKTGHIVDRCAGTWWTHFIG